jgi:filamentous hemagglutinin family protein
VGAPFSVGHADVTSSGLGTTVNQPAAGVFNITGGTRPGGGTNLFHSFGNFSLNTPESANFLNNSGLATTNILSRVTGGNPSNIFGTINSTAFPGANLFLMNPAGIVFGANAQLNVAGSFHATTADYIKLGNDGIFYADPAKPTVLSVAAPSAFGFLTNNPGSIEVRTGGLDDTFFPTALLQVPEGQTLSLVGGNAPGSSTPGVAIGALDGSTPGYVLAPAGRVNLVSVASAGEAAFDGKGFNVDSFPQLGTILVGRGPGADIFNTGASIVDGKEIFIRGGRLEINNGVIVPGGFATELSFVGLSPLPNGGEVNIKVTNDVTITGTDFDGLTFAPPGIFVYTGDFFNISPEAKVPDVNITAGSVSISGFAGIQTNRNAPGQPGNVVINANTVNVGSGGSVVLFNAFEGPGGNLIINAKDVNVTGDGNPSPVGFEGLGAQGVVSFAYFPPDVVDPRLITADSGNITINASNSLNVTGLGQITTDSRVFGRAGDITINSGDTFLAGTGQFESGVIASQSAFAGDAGNVTINAANTITIKDGFRISSTSLGSGNAGNVNVTAGKSINLSNDGRILGRTNQPPDSTLNALFNEVFLQDFDSLREEMGNPDATMMEVIAYLQGRGDIQIPDLDLTPGDAGTISVSAPALTLNAAASIQTSTGWEGNAGQIVGNVGSLSVNGGSFISSSSGIVLRESDGTIIEPVVGPGNAGSITLTASDTISVAGSNSAISTTTFGDGNAGSISLSANQVNVQSGGGVTSESGGTLAGQLFVGVGNAGQITMSTPTLTMADGGTISVNTFGAGNAGNILLNVTNLTQTGGSTIDSSTSGAGQGGDLTVTAANSASISGTGTGLFSTASGSGAGGNIQLQAGQLVQLADNATLSAQSTGTATATAGNITITTPTFETQNANVTTGATLADGGNITITTTGSLVHLTDSQITTSVESGVGSGGNITINSDLIVLDDSQVLANAFGGPGGNITITGDVFLVNSGGQSPTSLAGIVEASSALSTPGTINIEATVTDVSGTVAQLPEAPLQATELLRAACAARFVGGKTSSLVLGGRDGLPLQPGSLLPSPPYLASTSDTPSTISSSTGFSLPTGFSLLGSSDRLSNRYSLLPNFKCSL